MNNRIQELKLVVARSFDPIKHYSADEYEIEFDRRFAEFLINECVDQCMSDDYKNILNHFGMSIKADEDLEEGCRCGFDGGTGCGAIGCEY